MDHGTCEDRYRSLLERVTDVIWTCRADGTFTFITPNVERLSGYTADETRAQDFESQLRQVHPEDKARVRRAFARLVEQGVPFDVEYRRLRRDGEWVWVRNRSFASYEVDGVLLVEGMLTDVSERKRLEAGLRHSQKMEAIGQLTGGIAHDFNNILASILANAHFLIDDLADHDPRRADVEEIRLAAERAASLTRHLLAFSRKQILAPKIVDLNVAVTGVENMMQRLIGEDIELTVRRAERLGSVRMDVGQLEQLVMNLVVNARDAMPDGGKLLIETANLDLADEHEADRVGVRPGEYVVLSVTDTGCGMDDETKSRIFEPFFTTKEAGKGTGLGLSTCYGIVEQSGGYIWVFSEPGHGTVFEIYLPRVNGRPDDSVRRTLSPDVGGTETVLLVEDDARVRTAVARMLEARGYRVVRARDGAEAIELAKGHSGSIDLVLTDVLMPGANGPEVVRDLRQRLPSVRALLMSGYTDHAAFGGGAPGERTTFIQKPFAPAALARKVREVLDAGAGRVVH